MRALYVLLQIVLAAVIGSGQDADSKVVLLEQGPVRGYKHSDYNLYVFYEIPYATAPTGTHKYRAPLPAPTWAETRDTVLENIICPQVIAPQYMPYDMDEVKMTEDCLVANVYVPDTNETNLSVLVYVHGGAYLIGDGRYITHMDLAQRGEIIVVDFNYRLGVHGFLCLGTEDIPGNAGMKDQVALLHWVKNNIANFGGNPDDVTLAGFSAGSSSVEHLMLSEMARGLFHKVIPESGSALNVWSVQLDPIETAKLSARDLNFISDDINELEEFYKTTPLEDLAVVTEAYVSRPDSHFIFTPCIERHIGADRFLKETPLEILQKGNFSKLPMLVGFANMEGLMRLPSFDDWKQPMNAKFSDFLPADLEFESDVEKEQVAMEIKQFYFGDNDVNDDTKENFINYFSDVLFRNGVLKALILNVKSGNQDIYLYQYSYVDDDLLAVRPDPVLRGASHCAQSFAIGESIWLTNNSTDGFIEVLKQIWINFVKTGKPVPDITPEFPEGWPAVSADTSPYMVLDLPFELMREPLIPDNVRFWDEIYGKYYRMPVAQNSGSKNNPGFWSLVFLYTFIILTLNKIV